MPAETLQRTCCPGTVTPALTPVYYAIVIGVLVNVSLTGLVAFCMVSELAAISYILAARSHLRAFSSSSQPPSR